jgi:hypothetical protein
MASDFDRRVEELASTQHNVFTVAQVLLLQGTHEMIQHRCRTGRWVREGRGLLRLVGAPPTFRSRLHGVILAAGCPVVASHASAAALHGLPGFAGGVPEVTALPGGFVRRAGVRQHRTNFLPDRHRCTVDGIASVTVARALLDMTATEDPRRVERATDDAMTLGLVTGGELGRVLDEAAQPGRRKLQVFRAIVAPRRADYVPVASELEARVVELFQRAGLPEPERQVDLADAEGWIGRYDFVFRGAWLVVEADGRRHRLSPRDREADAMKDERLGAAGWTVLRLSWHDVTRRGSQVVATVGRLLAGRAA